MTRRLHWIWKTIMAIVAVVALLAGGAAFILYPQILKAAPEADYPTAKTPEEANLQDIDYLGRLIEVDRSFAPEAKAKFVAGIAELKSRAGSLSRPQLEMEAARLVALADNGHTNVKGVSRGISLNALPIRINRFEEGYFIVRARPEFADLLGARIITINGRTPEAHLQALAPFVGGAPTLRREYATYMLISPQALHAVGLAEREDRATLTMRLTGGEEVTRDLLAESSPANGTPRSEPGLESLRRNHWPQRDLSPVAAPVDVGEWLTVLDPKGALPLYLKNPNSNYWSETIPELDAVYVQINSVLDQGEGPSLSAFLEGLVDGLKENPVRNAIVDLRFNPGGNNTLTAAFTKALPAALPADGRIFILTSGNTFSAAHSTVARLKYFGGDRAVITGEPMGERPVFWSEGRNIFLPNSKLQIGYATALHDWENGCRLSQVLNCHFVNYFIGVPAGKLTPDLWVIPRFADYAVGEDTALQVIAAELRGEGLNR